MIIAIGNQNRPCVSYKNQMTQQFAAAPKVVKPKKKYKEQPQEQQEDQIKLIYNNLMWDKRIFRGNTYSAIVISKKNDNAYDNPTSSIPAKNQPQQTTSNFESNRRANIQIFTDEFVQSLTDKPPRYEYASQTEPLPDNAVIRHRMQNKAGLDIQTQIWDTDLFDFDYEVESLLNVLCGRTLEISRMEVLQEEELRIMSNRQQELRLYEKEENKKIQNMYDEQDKLEQQNLEVINNFKKEKEKKIKTHKRVFSRVIAKQYLRDIKKNTLIYVDGNGYFRHAIDSRLITELLPKLYIQTSQIAEEQSKFIRESQVILNEAKKTIVKEHAWAKEVERTRRKAITDKRQEKARQKVQRKLMEAQQKLMRKFIAEEKLLAQQQQARKALQGAKEEGAVEQS